MRNLCCQLPHASSASGDNRTGPTLRQSAPTEGGHLQRTTPAASARHCSARYEDNSFPLALDRTRQPKSLAHGGGLLHREPSSAWEGELAPSRSRPDLMPALDALRASFQRGAGAPITPDTSTSAASAVRDVPHVTVRVYPPVDSANALMAAGVWRGSAEGEEARLLSSQREEAPPLEEPREEEPADCKPPDPRGYLFPLLSNQFNNQLIGLAENIRLAQRLGRILVLSGFVEAFKNITSNASQSLASDGLDFYHPSVQHRLTPIPDIIQLRTVSSLVDCVSLETFKTLCVRSRSVEAHAFVPEWEPRIRGGTEMRQTSQGRVASTLHNPNNTTTVIAAAEPERWQIPERLYQCRKETWPEPCGASGFDNYRVAPLPELSDLQFTQVRLLAHDSVARVPLSSFPDGAEVPTLITDGLLFKTDATIPPFARSIDAVLGTLGSFRWAAPLQTAMDRYVDTSFGPDPFVAIHWRRGYSDNVFTVRTAEEVATELLNARRTLQEQRGDGVPANFYIASNQLDEADLQRVAGLMNISGMNLHSLLPELARSPGLQRLVGLQGRGKGLDELSRVEQGVCAQAAIFIGTPMSTWSANVNAFRGLYSLDSSVE